MISRQKILEHAARAVSMDKEDTPETSEHFYDTVSAVWSAYQTKYNGTDCGTIEFNAENVIAFEIIRNLCALDLSPSNTEIWEAIAGLAACAGEISSMYDEGVND